jgi:hypothetical protein
MVTTTKSHKHIWKIERLPYRDSAGVLTCPGVCRCGARMDFRAELLKEETRAVEDARKHSSTNIINAHDACSTLLGVRRHQYPLEIS